MRISSQSTSSKLPSQGKYAIGELRPSSEWRIHRDIFIARPEIGATLHAHTPHATALACCRLGIPAFHYMVAVAGDRSIPCAPYAAFGTQALSDHVVGALRGRRACLMANHGMMVVGIDLKRLYALSPGGGISRPALLPVVTDRRAGDFIECRDGGSLRTIPNLWRDFT